MNAADKTVRHDTRDNHGPWNATAHGLDPQLGTGQLDGWGSAVTLAAGSGGRLGATTGIANTAPPTGGPPAPVNVFTGAVGPDSRIVATVTWDRVVTDNGAGMPFNTRFTQAANQPNLDLFFQGPATQSSAGAGGSVEHINALIGPAQTGNYTLSVVNNGTDNANFSIAYAVSPMDANPGTREVFFSVRDQRHVIGGQDRIREGRPGTAIRTEADSDANRGAPVGVESDIWRSTMQVNNTKFADGRMNLGLNETATFIDDAIDALSFGRDDLPILASQGGKIFFSVDAYATGLSYYGLDNPNPNAVLDEATIVAEAAGDVFRSHNLRPGANPLQNQNRGRRNEPDRDFLHPDQNKNTNQSFADSYFMGQMGPRLADNEDDLTGLEGLGGIDRVDRMLTLVDGFVFFSLDHDSPSGHTADVLVSNRRGQFRTYASAAQLGLLSTDNLDALLLLDLNGLDADGWPTFDPTIDWLVFSVDRDSRGIDGAAVRTESMQGEVPGDLFLVEFGDDPATPAIEPNFNRLFLEATDLGLQEVPLGMNWLSDNLDALDIPDVSNVPEPSTFALLSLGLAGLLGYRWRRWKQTA